jgi:hypothetical protein
MMARWNEGKGDANGVATLRMHLARAMRAALAMGRRMRLRTGCQWLANVSICIISVGKNGG